MYLENPVEDQDDMFGKRRGPFEETEKGYLERRETSKSNVTLNVDTFNKDSVTSSDSSSHK